MLQNGGAPQPMWNFLVRRNDSLDTIGIFDALDRRTPKRLES
ncbi:hypothetical protein [Methylosinus sp. RM1]|nr:hypothetical protein [Methylosinus sp. RM1]